LNGDAAQALVAGPQFSSRGRSRGGEQVDIDISGATPEQGVAIDKAEHVQISGDEGAWQVRQGAQYGFAPAEISRCKFSDDDGLNHAVFFIMSGSGLEIIIESSSVAVLAGTES
jgi:hypothetical protein